MATPFNRRKRRGLITGLGGRAPFTPKRVRENKKTVTENATLFKFTPSEVINLLKNEPDFLEKALQGYYIYLDGAIVLKSKSCISTRDGKMFPSNGITVRCCLAQQVIIRKVYDIRKVMYGTVARGKGGETPGMPTHSNRVSIDDRACIQTTTTLVSLQPPSLINSITPDNLSYFITKPNDSFCVTFKKHMTNAKISVERLAESAGVSVRTVQRMRNEAGYRPTLKSLVGVCLAMHLHPSDSTPLLQLAGYTLNSSEEEQVYSMLLSLGYLSSMDDINDCLDRLNLPNFRDNN